MLKYKISEKNRRFPHRQKSPIFLIKTPLRRLFIMKPFLIPGYVYYYEKDNDIFVTSKLHQDIVKLNVPEIKTEFINLYKNKETCTL